MVDDLFKMGAAELSKSIRNGERSPQIVVEKTLDRINKRNKNINAFITICDESARKDARRIESAIENNEDVGSLAGVPVAIKDLTDVAGTSTTFGSVPLANNIAKKNDIIVQRLKDAGAVVVGKTNTPEFGRKTITDNKLVGATKNPWRPSLIAGGSSGGSAAALADGQVPLAQGTDVGGSIRIPSAVCGTVGMIPDFGRVPLGNSRSDAFIHTQPFSYSGPMARNVEDIALTLDVLSGPNSADPYSLPHREGSYLDVIKNGVDNWSIAYSPDLGICRVDDSITEIIEKEIGEFEAIGANIKKESPEFETDHEELHNALLVLLRQRYLGLYEDVKSSYGIDLLASDDVTEEVTSRIRKGKKLSPEEVRQAERIRTKAYDTMRSFFSDYDLLVAPTIGCPPFKIDTSSPKINNKKVDPNHGWVLTWPFNLTGNPAMSIPVGTVNRRPVGIQLVGQRLADIDVICAGAAYERRNPWNNHFPYLN